MNTVKIKLENCKTKIIAHRGFACCNIENSLPAFTFAEKSSAYAVECDVQPSINGELFVFHDTTLKRLTGISGCFRLSTSKKIRQLKLISKNKQLQVPTFIDFLKTVKTKVKVIEIKGRFSVSLLNRMLENIKKFSNVNDCIFISFNLSNLKRLKMLNEQINVQWLCETYNEKILNLLVLNNIDLSLNCLAVTKTIVDECHKNNIKVGVWTVDDKNQLMDVLKLNVDFVTTNKFEIV